MSCLPLIVMAGFADRPFAGNPEAVVRFEAWLPHTMLQGIAAKHPLSEAAFVVPELAVPRPRRLTRPSRRTPRLSAAGEIARVTRGALAAVRQGGYSP